MAHVLFSTNFQSIEDNPYCARDLKTETTPINLVTSNNILGPQTLNLPHHEPLETALLVDVQKQRLSASSVIDTTSTLIPICRTALDAYTLVMGPPAKPPTPRIGKSPRCLKLTLRAEIVYNISTEQDPLDTIHSASLTSPGAKITNLAGVKTPEDCGARFSTGSEY